MVTQIKVCGVWFGRDYVNENEKALLTKIVSTFDLLRLKRLPIQNRVVIVNVVALAKLWFVGSVVPLTPRFLSTINKHTFKFIWRSTEWVRRNVMYNSKQEGGLGVLNARKRLEAYKLRELFKIVSNPESVLFPLVMYWLGIKLRFLLPVNTWNKYPQARRPSHFYKQVLNTFIDYSALSGNKPLMDKSLKELYTILISNTVQRPRIIERQPTVDFTSIWPHLFSSSISLEARETWWKVVHGVLPVRDRLVHLKIINNPKCIFCNNNRETLDHLFVECNHISLLRDFLLSVTVRGGLTLDTRWIKFLEVPFDEFNSYWAILLSEYIHLIWRKRNEVIFNKKLVTPSSLLIAYKCVLRERIRVDF